MEKVKVVKAIPGILNVGDILTAPFAGSDFILEETDVTIHGSSERFVSFDYVTVSENIPQFFVFVTDDIESSCNNCSDCDCDSLVNLLNKRVESDIVRTDKEINERYDFFQKQFDRAFPDSEAQVVYKNLMWFIEWLKGQTQLLA